MLPRLINSLLAVALLVSLVTLPFGDAPASSGVPSAALAGPGGVSVAYAQGSLPAIPSSWPSNLRSLQIGRSSPGDEVVANMVASAPFAFRYQYLAGGVNTASHWSNWDPDGSFATNYIQRSVAQNVTPVFTYYMIYQSAPANGTGGEPAAVRGNLNNTSTMSAYYADLKLFFQRAAAFPSNKVVLHVEPDMWGYIQQDATNDNAASVSVKVGSTGVSDVSSLPDTAAGLAQAIVRLRNLYGSNVILAYHVSDWGTGTDIALQDPSDGQLDQLGDRAAAFYSSLGADFDVAFSELGDRDAAFDQAYNGMGAEAWWTDADFTRHARFIGRFVQGSGKRMVLWQVPVGNTKMRAMNNTNFHFQDNRVEKLLDEPSRARLQTYVNAGVMAFLFGAGHYWATSPTDASGDGVTNPAAINGNTQTSYNADDDGGFFHNRVTAYYTTGAMSIPAGVTSPATPTPTVTPTSGASTPTPVVPPGSYTQAASAFPSTVAAGSSTTITAIFASGTARTALTDIELYSSGSTKMHQAYFDSQSFAAGQHRSYQTVWNVPPGTAPGTYTVMLGMFPAGWGGSLAWNSNAATIIVTAAGAPTSTPTRTPVPTVTPTPTATQGTVTCSPRPPVLVDTTASGNSLRVDLSATGQNNRLLTLQFSQTSNALVDVGGQNGRTGAFPVTLPVNTVSTSFYLRRGSAGAATAMLTVVDRCGSWSTFVGGGPGGGF